MKKTFCDRCKKEIEFSCDVDIGLKHFDICSECYKELMKFIESYKEAE